MEQPLIMSTAEFNEFRSEKEALYLKYKAVTGSVPTKRDLAGWKEQRFMDFFNFATLFLRYGEDGASRFVTPEKKIREVEQFILERNHPYHEFIFRVGRFAMDPDFTHQKYYYKFAAMVRQVGKYLRENPTVVTKSIQDLIENEPRFNWCLKNVKVITTDIGAEIIAYENSDDVVPMNGHTVQPVTHEQKYAEALMYATDLFHKLSKSISAKDIAKMNPKDKVAALAKMAGVMSLHKNFKPGKSVFNQIVIHNADREVLEDAFLQFGKKD